MAAKTSKPEESSSGKSAILAILLVAFVGLGGGYLAAMLLVPPTTTNSVEEKHTAAADHATPPEKEKSAHEDEGHGSESDADKNVEEEHPVDPATLAIAPLPPVITNIAEPKSVWVRLEGSIVYVNAEGHKSDDLPTKAAQYILTYLRTIKLTDIQSSDGIYFLTDDLNETVKALSHGEVQKVLITGLIVE